MNGYNGSHDEDKMNFECTSSEAVLGSISKDDMDYIHQFFERKLAYEIKYLS